MRKLFILIAIVLINGFGVIKAQTTGTRPAATFTIKNLGIATEGSIGGLQTQVHFIPADIASSSLEASVDVNTINTGSTSRDEHLRSDDFFDVAHYPKISLKSIALKRKSGSSYTGTFTLTIKGRSKQIQIPFTVQDKDNAVEFKAIFKINRLDYGVGSTSMILSDEVTVNIDCEEKKQKVSANVGLKR